MQLSESEQHREDQQRRASDSWMQIKSAEIQHRNATIVAVGTLAGLLLSGSWWLSGQAAEEKIATTKDKANANEIRILNVQEDVKEAKDDRKEMLRILRDMNKQ